MDIVHTKPSRPTRPAASHNLPAAPGRLIGRERDVVGIVDQLASSRLVTVTGPAGVGKTRLGLEAAARAADRYPDGVWLVELAAARHPDEVAQAVAAELSVDARPGPLSVPALVASLRDRRMLLVLDNCEHLVESCAALSDRLLRGAAGLTVLATSQEELGIPGEWLWRVGPLPVPAVDAPTDPAELARYAAVRLFVERARAQRADFALTGESAPAVAEICRRLDGIPLAIELAAARVSMLDTTDIARRLDDRFGLLRGGARTALPRQQTLRAALEWSHALLVGAEAVLLRRLAVFAGGWTVDAAAEVCAGGEVEPGRVFDLLDLLVSRSLVVAETDGRSRYRLLDTTRAYAYERLAEAEEVDEFEARHASWCVALAERAEPELTSGDQRVWLRRLEDERDNLHVALSSAVDCGDGESSLRLTGALVLYWSMRGRLQEGLRWLERAHDCEGGTPRQRAVVLWGAGLLARALADYPTAKDRASESLAIARRIADGGLVARAQNVLGAAGVSACDGSPMTMGLLEESVDLAEAEGDSWCQVASLVSLGFGHLIRGEPASAWERFQRCLDLGESEANEAHRVHALIGLGRVMLCKGDYGAAEPLLDEAASLARDLGIRGAAANALRFLGEAAGTRGDYDTARRRFQESLDVSRWMGAAVPTALALSALGQLALSQGDTRAAGQVLETARALGIAEGLGEGTACALTGLGAVERALGDGVEARSRLDEALAAARRANDHEAAARALLELGRVAHDDGDNKRAVSLLHEAMTLFRERGDRPCIAGCLEALGRVETEEGNLVTAARVLAAAQGVRDAGGYPRAPVNQYDHDADVAVLRRALGPEEFAAAWAEGAAVSLEDAIAYASRGRGQRGLPGGGWAALSTRERDAVLLAAEGLTNPEIGKRMLISARTVQSHLAHAFAKLGVSSRKQLAEAAAREGALG